MRWTLRWIAILFIFAVACTDNKKVPEEYIPKDRMEKIMWDMVQADRYVSTFIMTRRDSLPVKKEQASAFYERVFRLHGITKEEFQKSYNYYLGRPDLTKVLFDSISARAEKRRNEVYDGSRRRGSLLFQRKDSLRRRDSLRIQDSIDKANITTEEMSDSALRKALFK
jgi:hypothetical protein